MKLEEIVNYDDMAEKFLRIYLGPDAFDFADKPAFMKALLKTMTNDKKGMSAEGTRFLIKKAREAGYDYPEFKVIEKSLTESTDSDGIDLGDTTIPWKEKDRLIRYLLLTIRYHQDDPSAMKAIRRWIKTSRERGYDYPEFMTIEKSIPRKGIREAKEDEGIRPWYEAHEYWDPKLVKFSDKRELLRFLLACMKKTTSSVGSFYEKRIPLWIKRSRDAGYDYPEFKTIEKSLAQNDNH